jgi:hypothetical protein
MHHPDTYSILGECHRQDLLDDVARDHLAQLALASAREESGGARRGGLSILLRALRAPVDALLRTRRLARRRAVA